MYIMAKVQTKKGHKQP